MGKRLYVGNLPYQIDSEGLRDFFMQFGDVADATVINDNATGRSKGFGFVEMETEEGAQEAVDVGDGMELDNRPIRVNEARPREPRGPRGRF